jgi:HK97 gp10 family phage protein
MPTVKTKITVSTDKLDYYLSGQWKPMAEALTEQSARKIEAKAKTGAPVLTGFLRNSFTVEKASQFRRVITDGTNYGIFQELGTRFIRAKHFLTKAAESEAEAYFNNIAGLFG